MRSLGIRQLAVLVLGIAVSMAVAAGARADLIVNVSEEYGGYYRPNDWYPIVVSVQNQDGKAGDQSANFSGTISIESDSYGDREGAYEFVRDIEVPSGSILRFTIHVKIREEPATQPTMLVRADNGRLIQSIPLNVQALRHGQVLMATVSDEARNYYFPRHGGLLVNRQIQRAFVSPRNLPTHWAGYDPVDVMVFPGWPDARFGEKNLDALRDWVSMGGTLVFLGGSQSVTYGNDFAAQLLPVQVNGSRRGVMHQEQYRISYADESAEIDPKLSVLLSDVTVNPGAEVILDASGGIGEPMPMLVRRQLGRGQILFLGTDLEAPSPLLDDILAPAWMATIPSNNIVDWRYQYADEMGRMKLVTGRAARPPNVIVIILICVLYTAIVGPVNFFVLSRMGRIQLAWFTVPAIVFLFSGLIYLFGSITKGGQTIGREITLLAGAEGENVFEERSTVSIFVPSADEYFLNPSEPNQTVADSDRWHDHSEALADLRFSLDVAGPSTGFVFGKSSPVIESDDDHIGVRSWPLRTFDTARFEVRGPRTLSGAIESDLTYHSQSGGVWLEGSIDNETGLDFYDAAIVAGGKALPMRAFNAGASRAFDQSNALYGAGNTTSGAGARAFVDIRSAFRNPAQTAGADEQTDSYINHDNALRVIDSITKPPYSGGILPPMNGGFYFVGLAESSDLTVETNLERNAGSRAIVVVVRLNPLPAPGPFSVPEELMQVDLQYFTEEPGAFQIETGSPKGIVMRPETVAVFSAELPFRHPGIVPVQFGRQFRDPQEIKTEMHNFEVGAYRLRHPQGIALPPGSPTAGAEEFTTPYSGRTWVGITFGRKQQTQGGGMMNPGSGFYSDATIPAVGFSMRGIFEPGG